ncbi:hypothetical protein [Pedosphaera parvula]|uniref:Uncharacterized protein n=1 Tax=Pedosphaera parvula (strain Ellin514) TaxID=320771 RepID=B9XLW8_PEDPL|nr:hypothetical protein [Pedosphaera parvula]EEF59225.1 hypothetical protein Cflav_PD2430 [Pedosphaera parvula Ellin514]
MKRRSEQGVALVVTLILLSVITFMAVAFLAISRHEREGVINRSHQNDSVFAADAAIEHIKAKLVSEMLVNNNGFNVGLLVSTNFINTNGFVRGLASFTNVNYDIRNTGQPLTQNDFLQNVANLLILPRPPVFVSTNQAQRNGQLASEFRFYLDFNRNGVYDTNGWVTPYYGLVPPKINPRAPFFAIGDPEWIGILDRPELPHSRSNQFVARYAFIALPMGSAMDINYLHNVAKYYTGTGQPYEGFRRDQGVGTWEINVGAFLFALNPTVWGAGGSTYAYDPIGNAQTVGLGFQDAADILAYRFNNNWNNPLTFAQMYPGATPSTLFQLDHADGYSLGLLATNAANFTVQDPDFNRTTTRWSGSDNTNWFFTPQDFFKVGSGANSFSGRLASIGLPSPTTDTTNQYTFYNLLQQLGVDSMPESGKINVNYENLNGRNATNFQNWAPVEFFTNAANAMLSTLSSEPGYTNLSTSYIPLYPTNGYTPAVHRMLQLAANIYDATTSREFRSGSSGYPYFPSVFKPILGVTNGNEIYIKNYVEVATQLNGYTNNFYDLSDLSATNLSALKSAISANPTNVNVYGIPWVIGAKKGFPNFNEFSMGNVMQLTRRIQIKKDNQTDPVNKWHYRTQYAVGISNVVGVEMWNSYSNAYPRDVKIIVNNDLTMWLTNDLGVMRYTTNKLSLTGSAQLGPNIWLGATNLNYARAFSIPLSTNYVFVPDSILHYNPLGLQANASAPSENSDFEENTGVSSQNWGLNVTNRLRVMMIDSQSGRLLDFVELSGLDDHQNIMQDLQNPLQAGDPQASASVWDSKTASLVPQITQGMWNQIQISLGSQVSSSEWVKYMINTPNEFAKAAEIANFQLFYTGATNLLKMQTPFVPTGQLLSYNSWQANDPLVHFTSWDLGNTNLLTRIKLGTPLYSTNIVKNIGLLNDRYSPWGGNPNKASDKHPFDLAYKDPLVARSDNWQFPTNRFPSVGWLGRVHRGTPWQTIYLKSPSIATNQFDDWEKWTGNRYKNQIVVKTGIPDAPLTHPTNDWKIVGLFTAAPNDNAARGQLSINQSNAPSWYAMLGGAIALSNSTPDIDLDTVSPQPAKYTPFVIDPIKNNLAISNILVAINDVRRTNYLGGVFTNLGNILAVPELSTNSPFLNRSSDVQVQKALSDSVYEAIPQQILGLLKVGQPQYVIYAYGQSLKPADRSLYQGSGPYFGLCTNYTVTGESLIRAVIHVENPPVPGQTQLAQPRVVVDQYNVLPPD